MGQPIMKGEEKCAKTALKINDYIQTNVRYFKKIERWKLPETHFARAPTSRGCKLLFVG